jgi:predicted permease
VVLSLLGGLLGLLFALWTTKIMTTLMPDFYVPNEARITVNSWVLLFCLVISTFTGVLFGVAPALQASRRDCGEALKDAGRGSGPAAHGGRLRGLLVVTEVALAVVLLVSAGLTIRSFVALQQVDTGFRPERVLTVGVPLPPKRYATLEQRNRFARELLDRVKTLPGVQAASIGNGGLPFGGPRSPCALDGQADSESRWMALYLVGADYLRTLGIPLRRGRMLSESEVQASEPVVVINEAAAKLWPAGEDPIGRRLRLDVLGQPPQGSGVLAPTGSSPYVTVIGVVGDTLNNGLRNEPEPVALVPYTLLAPAQRVLAIRSHADPGLLMNPLRAIMRDMDQDQPLGRPSTIEEALGFQTVQPRFTMALFSLFAGLGMALATAGIYCVLSYFVTCRTREIGVRMALGAQRSDVLGMIFSAGGKLVGAGIALGVLTSIGAAHLIRSRLDLFQVTTADPVSYLGVITLLVSVGFIACYVPARRATQVDPIEALRRE